MFETHFFETMLDNFSDGVYILDDAGNYIFVNSAYSKLLNMPKSVLLRYNVHDFLSTGQIDRCISDIVYLEKRQVVMFQDVWDTQNYGRSAIRQIVTSTPIFDEGGQVRNILAVVQPLDKLNDLYQQASQNSVVSSFSWSGTQHPASPSIVAESRTMRTVLDIAATVSQVDSAVLLLGESGTGKEVVANYIHSASTRSQKSLVVVNCASLPENLLEAELFGYEKGAFTGAAPGGKKGLFETAEGSTLFLDEINSMPLNLQGKVLRAIETKTVQRIGSTHTIPVDFRLITATNEDLAQLVEAKQFRADLYYRLNVIPIRLPPLRERREDIVPLARFFLSRLNKKYNKTKILSYSAIRRLEHYRWPGNVRELRNVIERLFITSPTDILEFESGDNTLSFRGAGPETSLEAQDRTDPASAPVREGVSLRAAVEAYEKQLVLETLDACGGSVSKAAGRLRLHKSVLYRKLEKYRGQEAISGPGT